MLAQSMAESMPLHRYPPYISVHLGPSSISNGERLCWVGAASVDNGGVSCGDADGPSDSREAKKSMRVVDAVRLMLRY
jgi:hypothetical protein